MFNATGRVNPSVRPLNMRNIKDQILGGTRLDSQGERLDYEDLQGICNTFSGQRIPLHQRHTMAAATLGFIENLRTVESDTVPNEWSLIGDVTISSGTLDDALRGFSISLIKPLIERDDASLMIYLPYPHYNDDALIDQLASDADLKVGKWIKKQADPSTVALFGTTLVFLLKPVWDEIYKELVSPWVKKFLASHLSLLQEKNLTLEHIQLVVYRRHQVEFRFVPALGKERHCFAETLLLAGIAAGVDKLEAEPRADNPGAKRLILNYAVSARAYEVTRIEFADGSVWPSA